MWKAIAVVMSIISSIIVITIYSTTLPDTQKQVQDNAEAIETLEGSVSDNAEAIETLENKKLYRHDIYITKTGNYLCLITLYNNTSTTINTKSTIISALTNNTAIGKMISATGWVYVSAEGKNYMIFGVFIAQGTNIRLRYRTMINSSTIEDNQTVDNDATIVDTVTEL